jgi:flagellar basal body-associated protein FliL
MSSPTGPSAPQPYPSGPAAPQPYQPQQPKKKRTGLIILLAIVGLVGLLLFGSCVAVLVSLGKPSGTVKEAEPAASASSEPTTEDRPRSLLVRNQPTPTQENSPKPESKSSPTRMV